MSVFFCLSVVLLQGALLLRSTILSNGVPITTICNDEDCNYLGLVIKSSIKKSVPACDDFYTHACGDWIARNPLSGRSIVDQYTTIKLDMYRDIKDYLTKDDSPYEYFNTNVKARDFYASCMSNHSRKEAGLQELQNMVNSNGGWPVLNDEQATTFVQKWQYADEDYSGIYDLSALYNIQVLPSRPDSKKHVITLSMPFIDMHDLGTAQTSLTPYSPERARLAHRKLMIQVARVVNDIKPSIKLNGIEKRIDDIITFQEKLEKIDDIRFEPNFFNYKSYRMITIKRLQHEWDKVLLDIPSDKAKNYKMNWLQTIRDTFINSEVSVQINETEIIAIEPGHYIKYLVHLLDHTKPATIVDYIHWNAIRSMLKYSGNEIEKIIQQYKNEVYGIDYQDSRWLECAKDFPLEHIMSTRMGHTDDLRIQQKVVRNMFYRIESQFIREIQLSKPLGFPWIRYIEKLSPHLNHWVGFPDWSRDVHNTSAFYESLDVVRDNYFRNILKFHKFMRKKELEKLRVPVDRLTAEWPVAPTDFVAAYDDRTDTVVLPIGLLKHLYMGFYKVPAIQYGALGSIIGHEIAHSIDNEDRLFDGLGVVPKTWIRQAKILYKGLRECYQREYDEYKIELAMGEPLPIDTNLTVREIIADNMGFRMAFRAFIEEQEFTSLEFQLANLPKEYTQQQIFFYSLAQSFCENPSDEYLTNVSATDEHPPAKIRINGALSRMEEFHKAFECKKGDRMRKEVSQCRFWGKMIDYKYVHVDFD